MKACNGRRSRDNPGGTRATVALASSVELAVNSWGYQSIITAIGPPVVVGAPSKSNQECSIVGRNKGDVTDSVSALMAVAM